MVAVATSWWSTTAVAAVQCDDIFTDPPTGNHGDALVPPPHLWPPKQGSYLECINDKHLGGNVCTTERKAGNNNRNWFPAVFNAGDYVYEEGVVKNKAQLLMPEVSARLYFKTLNVDNGELNAEHDESHLVIYVEDSMKIAGQSEINGILYVAGNLNIEGNAEVEGGVAAGGSLIVNGNGEVDFEQEAIDNADFGGMCENKLKPSSFHFDYGVSEPTNGKGQVRFETPFPQGQKPLVFLMPTITSANPAADRPASLELTHIDHLGFTYEQAAAPNSFNNTNWKPMPEVHWLAVNRGENSFPSGPDFKAGLLTAQNALGLTNNAWMPVTGKSRYSVFLTQRQDDTQNCWLTSTAEPTFTGLNVALDTSEVRSWSGGKMRCRPGGASKLNDVPVAYMAITGGMGKMFLNGRWIAYDFGQGQNLSRNGAQEPAQQCEYLNDFRQDFSAPPVFIAGKHSRNGGNGGWLRRCQLDENSVSMVVEEDQYSDAERRHVRETFGYVALERLDTPEQPIHHLELSYSGSPLACAPLSVTVKACDNADCSQLYPNPVVVNLGSDTGKANWTPSSLNVTGSDNVFLSHFPTTPVTLTASSPTASVLNNTRCRVDGGTASEAACTLSFAEAGFVIDDLNSYANKPGSVNIKAVRKSNNGLECQAAFSGRTKEINLSKQHVTQVAPSSTAVLTVNGGSVAQSPNIHRLDFDDDGVASVELQYPDAGHLVLKASYFGSGEEDGLVMHSVNGNLRSVPYGLCVTGERRGEYNALSDTAYTTAGSQFPVSVSAHAWVENSSRVCGNPVTPSFQYETIELNSEFADVYVPAPEQGASWHDGMLTPGQYQHPLGDDHQLQVAQNEVGVFYLSASVPAGQTYLNSGLSIRSEPSAAMGRFVPALYQVSGVSITQGCGSFSGGNAFTYMDQTFPLSLVLKAQNQQGQQTLNYQGWLGRAYASLVAESGDTGLNLSSRLTVLPTLDWQTGQASLASQPISFGRVAAPGADGPYPVLNLGVDILDGDGKMGTVADADMNPDTSGTAGGMTAKKLDTLDFRHGRVTLQNSYGHESATQNMPLAIEQWTPAGWRVNTDDVCTSVSPLAGTDINSGLATHETDTELGYVYLPAITPGQGVSRSGTGVVNGGRFELLWSTFTSGSAATYRGKVTAPVEVAPWLQWYWNWQGDRPQQLQDPRASVVFGQYRGHDKVIFHREVR